MKNSTPKVIMNNFTPRLEGLWSFVRKGYKAKEYVPNTRSDENISRISSVRMSHTNLNGETGRRI